ncbi:MAG: MFS transporter [Aphanocapsa feldmannii 277cV]|uniref:MFS transporter n=2 Tax=Aphanocapsa feldmannii TaxID=192050 RepID=A0A524RN63_9CHRO|nr:MAG: MFS transporter [Aphanocapsa feldmannii 288cV]TGG92220.1 MAG: MFS transporter [Aphanocapsa feldmannii 277cV]
MRWQRPSTLLCVFLTLLYDRLAESVVFPLLPFLVAPLLAEPSRIGLVVGLLGGSYTFAQFLATPVIGALSDHYGRRSVLVICIAGSALGISLFGIAGGLPLMFLGRILDGATGGTAATAQAVIADVTPPDRRARAFGLIGIAFGLGFMLGPGLGGLLAGINVRLPILVALGFALLNLLLAITGLKESLPPDQRQPLPTPAQLNPFRQLQRLLANPRVGGLALGFCLFFLVFNGFTTVLVPYLILSFSWRELDVGIAFCIVGVVAMLVQGGLIGPLTRRFGERRLTLGGIALVTSGCLLVPLATAGQAHLMIYSAVVLLAIGTGLVSPSLRAMISLRLDAGSQGSGLGSLQALQSLGSFIGPPLAGLIFTVFSPRTPFWWAIGALLAVGGLTTGALLRQRRQEQF